MASLVAQMVKDLPVMQETRVQSLSQEDPLEKGMATQYCSPKWQLQYSCLKKSMDRGTWWATVHGVAKSLTWLEHTHTQPYYMLPLFLHFVIQLGKDLHNFSSHEAYILANVRKETNNFNKWWKNLKIWSIWKREPNWVRVVSIF